MNNILDALPRTALPALALAAFLAAGTPTALGQAGPPPGAGNNLQAQVDALTAQVAALQAALEAEQAARALADQGIFEKLLGALDANVNTLRDADEKLRSGIVGAHSRISTLETVLSGVTRETVNGHPTVRFSGVNVQVVSGAGTTDAAPNGTGNVIIGYDEPRTDVRFFCSIGTEANGTPIFGEIPDPSPPAACTNSGGTWSESHKSGSHYLVVGSSNNYSQYGGIVVGTKNTSNNIFASVSGGFNNNASGPFTSVSGGGGNIAAGPFASVSGGSINTAIGLAASISGGSAGMVFGERASISGGSDNIASGTHASVSGGTRNTASGQNASVSGGFINNASGHDTSVSGGWGCTVSAGLGWDVGGTTPGCSPNVTQ